MANRTSLINADVLTSDIEQLAALAAQGKANYFEVDEAAYRVPVPWLCCFTRDDLRPASETMQDERGAQLTQWFDSPCTTVAKAIVNLRNSLPVFERVTGERTEAQAYWQQALDTLASLPLPYLTLDAREVLAGGYEFADWDVVARAVGPHADDLSLVEELAGCQIGVQPRKLSNFCGRGGYDETDPGSVDNGAALILVTSPQYRRWYGPLAPPSQDDEDALEVQAADVDDGSPLPSPPPSSPALSQLQQGAQPPSRAAGSVFGAFLKKHWLVICFLAGILSALVFGKN